MLGAWPSTPLPLIWKTCRKRANTWARGGRGAGARVIACDLRHPHVGVRRWSSWVLVESTLCP